MAAKTPDSKPTGISAGGPMSDGDSSLTVNQQSRQGLKHLIYLFTAPTEIANGDTFDTGLESIVEVGFQRSSVNSCCVTHSGGVLTFHVPGSASSGGVHVWHKGY